MTTKLQPFWGQSVGTRSVSSCWPTCSDAARRLHAGCRQRAPNYPGFDADFHPMDSCRLKQGVEGWRYLKQRNMRLWTQMRWYQMILDDIINFFCNCFFCKIWVHYSPVNARPTQVSKHGEVPGLLPREWRSNTSSAAGGFNQTHIERNRDVHLGDAGDNRIYKII